MWSVLKIKNQKIKTYSSDNTRASKAATGISSLLFHT